MCTLFNVELSYANWNNHKISDLWTASAVFICLCSFSQFEKVVKPKAVLSNLYCVFFFLGICLMCCTSIPTQYGIAFVLPSLWVTFCLFFLNWPACQWAWPAWVIEAFVYLHSCHSLWISSVDGGFPWPRMDTQTGTNRMLASAEKEYFLSLIREQCPAVIFNSFPHASVHVSSIFLGFRYQLITGFTLNCLASSLTVHYELHEHVTLPGRSTYYIWFVITWPSKSLVMIIVSSLYPTTCGLERPASGWSIWWK